MTIEPGSEWLHIESLTVVKVTQAYGNGWVYFETPFTHGPLPKSVLLSEFRPNAPVTPELLEGMGWERDVHSGWLDKGIVGKWALRIWPDSVTAVAIQFDGRWLGLRNIETLRDLLVLLRGLGVAYAIPESETQKVTQ